MAAAKGNDWRSVGGALDEENLVFETTKGIKPIACFDGMGMNDKVLRGVKKPSEIQQRAVLPILKGRDVIAQAQSGTGKTSMIAISVCQIGNTSSRKRYTNIKAHACIGVKSI
ncbi:unnamed protein product [Brassica napus]|uniref:(rape) hypothetical protein n=1 Tax=Brassica napus TaxID=3708 RepID=A0A816KZK6_BRANA|nr:unnamed protein product [Brassica napus]